MCPHVCFCMWNIKVTFLELLALINVTKGVPIWHFCRYADISDCRYANIADSWYADIEKKCRYADIADINIGMPLNVMFYFLTFTISLPLGGLNVKSCISHISLSMLTENKWRFYKSVIFTDSCSVHHFHSVHICFISFLFKQIPIWWNNIALKLSFTPLSPEVFHFYFSCRPT